MTAGAGAAARTSAEARVRAAFARIRAVDRPEVWISLRAEQDAADEARAVDARVAAGERLPLAGLVAAVKDNIDVRGLPTTAACPSYSFAPGVDATAVARLRAAGAVVLGKTNLDQFATGLVGTRSPYGAVRHAFDPARISGGSSSGSAVAVALGIVDVALGTDTAGSGRVPAALNGLIGVKPTRGLVPNTGVVPACRTLDCVTVFARELGLARRTAELLEGPDGRDPLARAPRPGNRLPATARVAVPLPHQLADLAPGWAEAFAAVVTRLEAANVQVVPVDIAPLLEAAALLYEGAFVAERTAAVGDHIATHAGEPGIDPTVAGIVAAGAAHSAVDWVRDRERLDLLGAAAAAALDGTSALLTPTTTWHPTIAEVAADPIGANSRMGRYTNFANLLDLAALAVPAGVVGGLPFGVMLTGAAFDDRLLADLATRILAPELRLFVVGAHRAGQPLNAELVAAGGSFEAVASTAPEYRLFALDTVPPKPGLLRVAEAGSVVTGEVWRLPAAGFGAFVAALPNPMTIGAVRLAGGETVPGFLVEAQATAGATDISVHGDWLAYRAALAGSQGVTDATGPDRLAGSAE